MAFLVLNVVAGEDLKDVVADDLDTLLDFEAEATIVAACWELKTETMEDATEEVFIDEVDDSLLLVDLSCGLAE